MSETTSIAWCDHSWNPWWGCAKVSTGCLNCYADAFQRRYDFDVFGYADNGSRKPLRTFEEPHWAEPPKWDRKAEKAGVRRRVFCASMADVFDNHPDAGPLRKRLWTLIRATPHLDWLLLTKRPEKIPGMLPADWGEGYPNVWLGASVENDQQRHRIALLTAVPARVHFLSCEPLVDVLYLEGWLEGVEWVIIGGESGPKARPMSRWWADRVMQACDGVGVPVFFKQTGAVLAREMKLRHSKGEDPSEWPEKWQRQEFPRFGDQP